MCGASCTRKMIVLFGPTGVGKTDASLAIAHDRPVEIINMDVGQLYQPFSIGTAKPDWKKEPIAHHLFDVIDSPRDFTVAEYKQSVFQLAHALWSRGKTPLLVGGSGFYLKSLLFPPKGQGSAHALHEGTWDDLYAIDPDRARHIKKNDRYRIQRALGIWHATGTKPSAYELTYEPTACFQIVYLNREREQLYQRINHRVDLMLEQGWLDEIKPLLDSDWVDFIKRKKLIGYNELIEYLAGGNQPFANLLNTIKKRTRHYAKRQQTFWRMLQRKIEHFGRDYTGQYHVQMQSVDLTLCNDSLYIKQLLS